MNLPDALVAAIAHAGAKLCVGYPWWLRPWLAPDVIAITLGRRIYVSTRAIERSSRSLERLVHHELAHVRQVARLGLMVFLARYTTEFLRHLWQVRHVAEAYSLISFEVEARAAEEEATRSGL